MQNIVIWHERIGKNIDEIAEAYGLTLADIHAALAYYFDHREEIDRSIAESESFVEQMRQAAPSKVRQKLEQMNANGGADQVLPR